MKKKSLLIFLVTAMTAATAASIGAGCAKKHQHAYNWQSDAAQHWEQCECGDKQSEGAHADQINNDSKVNGADGKCDVCGRENYSVAFNVQGHGTAPSAQTVYKGGKATKPATDPSASGYVFGGWYAEEACTTAFDFNAEVNGAKTVYAKWSVNVTFDMKGVGAAVPAQTVQVGGKATKPANDPVDTAADYLFEGWFADESCTTAFNFNAALSEAKTVYAKWVPDTRPLVSFDMGGHGTAPASYRVDAGSKISKPATDPVEFGYIFEGWCSDEDLTTPFDFENTEVTADTVIYANWSKDKRAIVEFNVNEIGTAPTSMMVDKGEPFEKPADPVADGYTFAGWYTDSGYVDYFDFEDGVSDDTILYAKWTVEVTFDVQGHGTAPKTQNVTVGKKVDTEAVGLPETDEDFVFDGWYADAACTTAFDLETAVINKATVVYAKWVASVPKLALEQQKLVTFGSEQSLGFVFVAPETWRYYISPGNIHSYACHYTTDLDENGVYYGDDYASSEKYFDLTYGQKISITFYRGAATTDTTKVCLIVNKVTTEPIPESWVEGTYTNGTVSLDFKKDSNNNGTVSWNSADYGLTYLGGSFNKAYFETSGSMGYSYTITQTEKDTLVLDGVSKYTVGSGEGVHHETMSATLNRFIKQDPIPVEKFSGVYKPANSDKFDDLVEINIYESGNGYVIKTVHLVDTTYKFTLGQSGSYYDSSTNTLNFGSYQFTANLNAEKEIVSINVNSSTASSGGAVVYTRTGNAPKELPERLPLPTTIELVGATLGINCVNNAQTWSDNYEVKITDYNNDSVPDYYTVTRGTTVYTLEIEGSGNDTVVKVYDQTHTTLIDTLRKKVETYKDLLLDGTANVITAADLKSNGYAYFNIPKSGSYTFTVTEVVKSGTAQTSLWPVQIYTNYVSASNTGTVIDMSSNLNTASKAVTLEEGNTLVVNLVEYGSLLTSLSLKVEEDVAAPEPSGGGNVINGAGSLVVETNDTDTYTVKFVATEAGTYHIVVTGSSISWGTPTYSVNYTVDGVQNGYSGSAFWGAFYKDGVSLGSASPGSSSQYKDDLYATVTVSAGQEVEIKFSRNGFGAYLEANITVKVEKA